MTQGTGAGGAAADDTVHLSLQRAQLPLSLILPASDEVSGVFKVRNHCCLNLRTKRKRKAKDEESTDDDGVLRTKNPVQGVDYWGLAHREMGLVSHEPGQGRPSGSPQHRRAKYTRDHFYQTLVPLTVCLAV